RAAQPRSVSSGPNAGCWRASTTGSGARQSAAAKSPVRDGRRSRTRRSGADIERTPKGRPAPAVAPASAAVIGASALPSRLVSGVAFQDELPATFAFRVSAGQVDELELDVVRIPEDEHGVRNRLVGVDHAGMRDAEFVQPAGPRVEVSAAGHPERDVVQAGPALVERLAGVGLVVVKSDRHAGARLHQQHRVAALLVPVVGEGDRYPVHLEYPL